MAERVRILFVCTGNVCRSPMAQAMLTHRLRERRDDAAELFAVASAGTGALIGSPMEQSALDQLERLGIVPADFAARDINEQILDQADLILTATKQHRSLVVSTLPHVVRRTFTIKEFARLAGSLSLDDVDAAAHGDDPPDRVRAVIERVARQRGLLPPVPQHEDDIADPYQQPAKRFAQTAADLTPAIDVLTELLVRAASADVQHSGVAALDGADHAEWPAAE